MTKRITLATKGCKVCHWTGRLPNERPEGYDVEAAWRAREQPHLAARVCGACDGKGFHCSVEVVS